MTQRLLAIFVVAGWGLTACTSDPAATPADAGTVDPAVDGPDDTGTPEAEFDVVYPDAASRRFCDLPGTVQFTSGGKLVMAGGESVDKLQFVDLPTGFCIHYFGNIGNTRQLRVAPGGELFVASPITGTTGGGSGGRAAIVILADDDGDGTAETSIPFLEGIPSTQGLLFANEHFYYQSGTKILRRPYVRGDRAPREPVEQMADVTIYSSPIHWPKVMDQADDGTIYVGNGGDQFELCDPTHPFRGGVLKLDGSPGGMPVAKGFRNPIGVRCQRGHNRCFATELSMDYTAEFGGREKLVPIRAGDDWGFPCCFTREMPAPDVMPRPDC
jgi:hypothetical protein